MLEAAQTALSAYFTRGQPNRKSSSDKKERRKSITDGDIKNKKSEADSNKNWRNTEGRPSKTTPPDSPAAKMNAARKDRVRENVLTIDDFLLSCIYSFKECSAKRNDRCTFSDTKGSWQCSKNEHKNCPNAVKKTRELFQFADMNGNPVPIVRAIYTRDYLMNVKDKITKMKVAAPPFIEECPEIEKVAEQ